MVKERAGEDLMPMKRTIRDADATPMGMLTARSSGVGSDHQRKSLAEAVRRPARALIGQACGGMVDRSNAEDGVRKGGAGLAVSPGQSLTGFARANPEGEAG